MRTLTLAFLLSLVSLAHAESPRMPVAGDCALFREGGEGLILTAPTYWLKGTILEVYKRPHHMGLCPPINKPRERYTRNDWQQMAAAYPCVTDRAKVRDVEAIRIRLRADSWDTPWSSQHGHNGWLFRGHFLNVELKAGVELDIDGTLLQRCEALP
ncbi:MAG: hypothetical protein H6943_05465 [Zoogloeaceae bacterium]|nr:hypothetical protein [Zoogloeaceae bacterium]